MDPVTIGVGLTVGKMIYGGLSSLFDNQGADDMRDAAEGVYDAQVKIADKTKGLSYSKANLAIDRAGDVKTSAELNVGFGTRGQLSNLINTTKNKVVSGQDFAGNKSSERRMELSAGLIQDQYTSRIRSISDTHDFGIKTAELAKESADIAHQTAIANAQKELNYALSEADEADRGFFEGMFS